MRMYGDTQVLSILCVINIIEPADKTTTKQEPDFTSDLSWPTLASTEIKDSEKPTLLSTISLAILVVIILTALITVIIIQARTKAKLRVELEVANRALSSMNVMVAIETKENVAYRTVTHSRNTGHH